MKKKKILVPVLLIAFSLAFLISAGFIINYAMNSGTQQGQYEDLASIVEKLQQPQNQQQQTQPTRPTFPSDYTGPTLPSQTLPPLIVSAYTEIKHPTTGATMTVLKEYAPIFEMNPHFVGWIKLSGTKINYPVVQAPYSPNYYLKRDFYKKYSEWGTIYANETAKINVPSDNVTLYGHNMNDGSMFAALHGYNKKEFYEQNPYITFDTLYEHHTYQVMAVFYTTDIPGQGFAYHTFVEGNAVSFPDYVAKCKELSLYDTGVTAVYGDKLLTLSTCDTDYYDDHGRFVVVAKRIY